MARGLKTNHRIGATLISTTKDPWLKFHDIQICGLHSDSNSIVIQKANRAVNGGLTQRDVAPGEAGPGGDSTRGPDDGAY